MNLNYLQMKIDILYFVKIQLVRRERMEVRTLKESSYSIIDMIYNTHQPSSSYKMYSTCATQEKDALSFEDDEPIDTSTFFSVFKFHRIHITESKPCDNDK